MFTGKYWHLKVLAFVISTVSAYASFWFGYASISTDTVLAVGVGLALVALCYAWAQLPAHLLENALAGRWGVCLAIIPAIAIALPADTVSTLSSVNAAKGMERHRAKIETVAYDDQRTTIDRSRKEIDNWNSHLSDIKRKAAWAGTRTPESFDGEIEAARLAVELEAKRGGCARVCEAKKTALGNLIAQRGMAEQYAKYQSQIEATKRIIDNAKTKSAEINPTPAVADLGNLSVAQMFRMSSDPDERSVELAWFGSGWILGLAFVMFPALLLLSVRWIELIEAGAVRNPFRNAGAAPTAPSTAHAAHHAAPPASASHTYVLNESDNSDLCRLLGQLKSVNT